MKKPSANIDFGRVFTGGDGSSTEKAVVIDVSPFSGEASPDFVGVRLEHIWIEAQFPGATPLAQRLSVSESRICDVMTIRLASGEERAVYFDIGSFFPKEPAEGPPPEPASIPLREWAGCTWTTSAIRMWSCFSTTSPGSP